MVNKERLDQIKLAAEKITKNVFELFNGISYELIKNDPENKQIMLRIRSILAQLDLISASKEKIMRIDDGLQAFVLDIEDELSVLNQNAKEVSERLEKAKKDFGIEIG